MGAQPGRGTSLAVQKKVCKGGTRDLALDKKIFLIGKREASKEDVNKLVQGQ